MIGLTRALVAAGARELIVSLWPVDDQTACLTMVRLHERLLANATPARALADATTAVRSMTRVEADAEYAALRQAVDGAAPGGRAVPANSRDRTVRMPPTIRLTRTSGHRSSTSACRNDHDGEGEAPQVRRALLIGSQTGGLTGVEADVAVMDEVLKPLGFTTVHVTGHDATADGIVAAYRSLIEDTGADDAALVYYSGHGGRVRNPSPGGPTWLQFIVPTDFDDRSRERVRCVLAEELSALQLELTQRTTNVTTILDCCHAARMSRDALLIPRAIDGLGLPVNDLERRWRKLREDGPHSTGADSNPDAVRVVACAPDQSAYELPSATLGDQHGAFTAALVGVLRGADPATLTWRDVLDVVRGAVLDVAPQRPEVEGSVADRLLFSMQTRSAEGVRPVRMERGTALLDSAALFGLAVGDTYTLVAPGGDVAAPLARATIEKIVVGRAVLLLDGTTPSELPQGTTAWPLEVALGARPVAVLPADSPRRHAMVAELTRSAQVRIVDDPAGTLATVRLDDTAVQVYDALGAPLYTAATARPPLTVAADVRMLARATHLRELASGRGPEMLPADVEVAWVRLLPAGEEEPLADGAHLFVGDRLMARLANTGGQKRFVGVVDVGVAGAVSILSDSEPDGVTLEPGEGYELGRDWFGAEGIELGWPDGLPTDVPRAESVVTIVADAKIDGLSRLQQRGVVARSAARGTGTTLRRLVDDLATGRRDSVRPAGAAPALRYRVERFEFVLHPVPRPDAVEEPPFEVDERPDPSFRLVTPRGAQPPGRIAVRLTDMVVHRNRALFTSDVRVEALVVTAGTADGGPPFHAETAPFPRVRDGDRLSFDDLIVYEGPVDRFLDLRVWVSRNDSPDVGLAELLAAETANPEVAAAVATLAGLAVAAPAAGLVAGSIAAVAMLVRTAARAIERVNGRSIGVYRTSLLPHQRFGVGRHPAQGLIRAQDMSFAFEVVDVGGQDDGPGLP